MRKILLIVTIMTMTVCFTACGNESIDDIIFGNGVDDILLIEDPSGYGEPEYCAPSPKHVDAKDDSDDDKTVTDMTWRSDTSLITIHKLEFNNGYDRSNGQKLGEITYYFDKSSKEDVCAYFNVGSHLFEVELMPFDGEKLTDAEKNNFMEWLKTIEPTVKTEYDWGMELKSVTGKKMNVEIPENLLDNDGPLSSGEKLEYSTDESCKVIVSGEKDENGQICDYMWQVIINDKSAGNEFRYDFYDADKYDLVEAEKYPGLGEKGEIFTVEDAENFDGDILDTTGSYSPPRAHDANGKKVKAYYRIEGDTLVEGVKPTNKTVYPITIE